MLSASMTLVAASQQVRLPLNRGTTLLKPPLFSELSGWSVLGITVQLAHRLLDDLDHFYHNLSQSAPGSEGQSDSCDRSHNFTDLLHDLRNILCRHTGHPRGNPHNGFRNHSCGFSTSCSARNAVQSALPRSVHVAEVVSETLVSELSVSASHRPDAATEDHHSCVDVRNQLNLFKTC